MEQDPELLVKYDKLNESVKEYITKLGCEASDIDPIGSFPLDNRTYERFMVARDNDLKKATDMLLDCIKWRYEKKPGHIKEDQIAEDILKSSEAYFGLLDKHDGQTVWVNAHLHVNYSKRDDDYHNIALFLMELGIKRALDKGTKAKATLVFYLGQFSMANMDYTFTRWLINHLANYYPETLRNILVVDSYVFWNSMLTARPWAFSVCWKLIKGWLDPRTAQKIVFLSMKELPNYIDPENIPKEFGGKDFVFQYERLTPKS